MIVNFIEMHLATLVQILDKAVCIMLMPLGNV